MNLEKIRNKIEKMEKTYQIDILDIIKKNNVYYTENNNGIFINMNNLTKKVLKEISEYIDYFDKQKIQLDVVEDIKKEYKNKFFKHNSSQNESL